MISDYLPRKITVFAVCLSLAVLSAALPAGPENQEIPWGVSLSDFKKNNPAGQFQEFSPRDNPEYKNKIMTFITAIDEKFKNEIIILRQKGAPMREYLFVRGKLCSKVDDWDVIPEDRQNSVMTQLKQLYGEPSIQKEDNFYINAFKSKTTNVLFYMLKHPDGSAKCKVYYYTSKLFRMLIMED
ncbi:MAG TPA: hypothetical protein PK926_13755 [Spirochaetota bacterium]|nr:hypothetical protein [Spirochaetota bacterium]HPI89416.1 hypothetical protein [Spirochaetota bacterium]HPR49626.1 hypothetical protein [Spirochaetota bacterium]